MPRTSRACLPMPAVARSRADISVMRAKCAVAGTDGSTLVEYPSSGGTDRSGPTEALDDPCAIAISSGNAVEWRDLADVTAAGPCARSALNRGLRSVASEPLRRGDDTVGSL